MTRTHGYVASALRAGMLIAGSFVFAGILSAQTSSRPARTEAKSASMPRLADGRPDLQGVWDFATATPLQRPAQFADKPVLTDAEATAFLQALPKDGCRLIKCDGSAQAKLESAYDDFWWDQGSTLADNRTSLVVDPPDGRIPALTPEAKQKVADAIKADRGRALLDHPEQATITDRCIVGFNSGPPMHPSAYNNLMQIVQATDHVIIFNEMVHNARIVPLDGRPHLASHLRQWTGDSRGRWEGDTLVVETTNFRADSIPGPLGSTSTDPANARLVERFRRRDAETLEYEYTISDSHTWTRPWTARFPMKLSAEPIYEYACHEGNYSMSNRMLGARAADRQSQTPAR